MSVFVGTSLDGFIARPDGAFDFLPEGGGEPHGFTEFYASIDTVLIGRNTFETAQGFPEWFYGKKRVVVLTHRRLSDSRFADRVEQMSGLPADIVRRLEETGSRHVYVDGGLTIHQFLAAGFVNEITVTRVPVLIGRGIPLFGSLRSDVKLRHLGTTEYKSGLVKSHYEVLGAGADPGHSKRSKKKTP